MTLAEIRGRTKRVIDNQRVILNTINNSRLWPWNGARFLIPYIHPATTREEPRIHLYERLGAYFFAYSQRQGRTRHAEETVWSLQPERLSSRDLVLSHFRRQEPRRYAAGKIRGMIV